MWLSLFAPEDIRKMSIPVLDQKGREIQESVPTLVVSSKTAKTRVKARRPAIEAHIPEKLWGHVSEFCDLVEQINRPYLQLDLVEVFSTTTPEEFEEELRGYLLAFESQEASAWLGLLQNGGFEDRNAGALSYEADSIRYGIRGYGRWND